MSRNMKKEKTEENSSAYNKILRHRLKCSICPPNKCENAKRKGKHGKTKPRYKDK